MTVKYGWAAGDPLNAANWSLSPTTYVATTPPGASDAAYLNGYLMTMSSGSWSVGAINDSGLAGSGLYCNTANLNLTVAGAVTSTVAATQSNGIGYGINAPTFILLGSSFNGALNIGSISSSGGSNGVTWMYPNTSNVATIGTASASGQPVQAGYPSTAFMPHQPNKLTLNLTSGTAAGGAECIYSAFNNSNANAFVVNCSGGLTATGYNAANNGPSIAIQGAAIFNGNISATAGGSCFQNGPLTFNGNVSATNAWLTAYMSNMARINGNASCSGNAPSLYRQAVAYNQSPLLMKSFSLSNGAIINNYPGALVWTESFTNDGTGVMQGWNGSGQFTWVHPGPAYGTAGATEIVLPETTQVQNGVAYGLSLTGTAYLAAPRVLTPRY